MNTGPAHTRSSHLDLAELIAGAAGQPVDDDARAHLARCGECRAEASRWNIVADGVRSLAADAMETDQSAPVESLRRRRPLSASRGRGRAGLAATAAAALVLVAGVGYGASKVVHISFGNRGTSSGPVLTAVSGCSSLEQATGTLERVSGSSLIIKSASGQTATVTTTAGTMASEGGAYETLARDITDGAAVSVAGTSSGGAFAATLIVRTSPAKVNPPPGVVVVSGTVADAGSTGFTLVESDGSQVRVTTASDTVVSLPGTAVSQLPAGATIVAVGSAGPHGTMAAQGVLGILQLPPGGPQLHGHARLHVANCSPDSVNTALAFGG